MFSNIFFILFILFLLGFSEDIPPLPLFSFFFQKTALFLESSFFLFFSLFLLNRTRISSEKKGILAQILLSFFCFAAVFVFHLQTLFPLKFFFTLFILFFYFFGLSLIKTPLKSDLFTLPFCLPFVALEALFDLAYQFQFSFILTLFLGITVAFLFLMFFPSFLLFFWNCNPLTSLSLQQKLKALCIQMKQPFSGFKELTPFNQAMTAAIVGVWRGCRYLVFTKTLLTNLSEEEILAIACHELGHSASQHVFLSPWVLSGVFPLVLGCFLTIESPLVALFFALIGAFIYFRYLFGYFSRLFEREADLYIFQTPISADFLISALNQIGIKTGYSHKTPCWHHFSLQERIDALILAKKTPFYISHHQKKIKRAIVVYSLFWGAGFLWILFSHNIF